MKTIGELTSKTLGVYARCPCVHQTFRENIDSGSLFVWLGDVVLSVSSHAIWSGEPCQ